VWERLRVATGLTPEWLKRSLSPEQQRASDIVSLPRASACAWNISTTCALVAASCQLVNALCAYLERAERVGLAELAAAPGCG
jgi:hypothetical protein